ncbi:MAG: GDP-mannose 4,6-dehydratase [Brevinematales bacterium]
MKKVFITGVAGFIGSNLACFFLKKNWEVWGIDNLITGSLENIKQILNNSLFHFLQADLLKIKLEKVLNNVSFDLIYHLASPASPYQYRQFPIETLKVNSLGTLSLLEFMKFSKSKVFVFASSSEVYGDPLIHPQKEDYWGNVNPLGWRACYDEGKRFGETICFNYFKKYDLDIRIARIFNTYGPNMKKSDGRVIANFIVQALQNKDITVYGTGEETRSFCYISDMIFALYLMGEKLIKGEVINLGNNQEKKIIEIAQLIKKMTNSSSKIVHLSPLPDDPKITKPDITKAKKLLGWQPKISLEKGLKLTINYFKNQVAL